MDNGCRHTLSKSERIHSRTTVQNIFSGSGTSIAIYPLRIVWSISNADAESRNYGITESLSLPDSPVSPATHRAAPVSILVSISKRRFHNAVDRNRIKRLIREAYRLNKHLLANAIQGSDIHIDIAFLCISDTVPTTDQVSKSMVKSLMRISDSL